MNTPFLYAHKKSFIFTACLFLVLLLVIAAQLIFKSNTPTENNNPSLSPNTTSLPETLKEKELQEAYGKERQRFLEEKLWVLELPLISNSYFISYDPELDEFLVTIYFSSIDADLKNQELSKAKREAIIAIEKLVRKEINENIVYFETKK